MPGSAPIRARVGILSPEVDIAVLETARGGILKRGLAYDRCTVGVVLNVSDDTSACEAAALIRRGALAACADPDQVEGVDERVLAALRRAFALCTPGDVLVYCDTSVGALVEALQSMLMLCQRRLLRLEIR